jgi:UDP-glucose 4-epimerase
LSGRQAEIYGDGKKTRDYMYVGDIVKANVMALNFKAPKGVAAIFNLSTGKETTLYTLYKKIAKLLGRPEAEPKFMPDRAGELMRSRLNNQKAKKIFKWQPSISLDQGLKKTVEAYLNKINAKKA